MSKHWLIDPAHLREAVVKLRTVAAAAAVGGDRREAAIAARGTVPKAKGGIAVIPLHGVIVPRADEFDEFFGLIGLTSWLPRVEQAVADDAVGGVVLDIDSPGGMVDGVPEAAARLFALRGNKPIVAVANTLAASAAYWIGTAADKLFVTPSGEVGSIGVVSMHMDYSAMLEADGIDVTIFTAGKYKAEFTPYKPLTDAAKAHEQGVIEDIYGEFVAAVAKHRGVPASRVRSDYGEGRVVAAKPAVAAGMADGVRSLAEVIAGMQGEAASRGRKAEARRAWARHRMGVAT